MRRPALSLFPILPILSLMAGGCSSQSSTGSSVQDAGGSPDGVAADSTAAEAGPGVDGTVSVDRTTTLATLRPAFAGLSYEKGHLPDGFFSASNTALVTLFALIGPSVLRLGGNSVDETEWQPALEASGPQPDSGIDALITPGQVDALAAFAKASNWTVIYGVDMKRSTPEYAALEAAYASQALGAQLYGFEIGNEPDLYPSTLLSGTWSYDIFKSQWESFAEQIRASVPDAPLTGPASASNYEGYTVPFATDEASRIELLTEHYYRANGEDATSTLALLLALDTKLPAQLQALDQAASKNGLPGGYRMAECNSFYNGGAQGISDTYGTALWAIDYLFTVAANGATGVNFHGGGDSNGYTPIADNGSSVVGVRPEFYGMLLFTKAGTGPILSTTASAGTVNFTAYAVEQSDGSTRIVLNNKDANSTVHTTVHVGKAVATASVMRLEGPSLTATTGMTIGGAPIEPTGAWTPAANPELPVSGESVTVDMPPGSAAVVIAE